MDDEIQFGDMEETAPRRQLRPDQNRHYAVVAYAAPSSADLPVFVDMDVMRDMEAHARSNTKVELGGVLLGGFYEDEDGNPFVFITDALRAEHYEATKGSFKFTHETWSDITRKQEEFPEEIQMVGWYHTHPGWGVFLSGMDTFICEHFFNKPLDVALVIDPCQSDRSFFQWTPQGEARQTRATGGFYLTASRYRLPELEFFAAQLEGTIAMPNDPRYGGVPGAYPPPVVHIAETRQTWLSIAVLGMLLMQFSVLALIAWRILTPPDAATLAATDPREIELRAQRELLDDIVGKLEIAPDGVVQTLEQQREMNDELQSVRLGLNAHIKDLEKTQVKLEGDKKTLQSDRKGFIEAIDSLKEKRSDDRTRIAELKKRLSKYEETDDDEDATGWWAWVTRWKWYVSGGALLLLVVIAGLIALYGPPIDEQPRQASSEDTDVEQED